MATKGGHEDSTKVVLSLCAGTDLANGQIAFSYDSKYFACCAGWTVKVYNTANGQCAQLLEGHTDVVTGLIINPANKLQLFSCGLDGMIHQWIYMDGVLLRTFSFYMPLHALVSMDASATSVSAIAHRPQSANCSVLRLPLKKNRKSSTPQPEGAGDKGVGKMDVLLPVCEADHRTVSTGFNGQYIAAVHGHELWIYSVHKKSHKKLSTEVTNPFTCVCCHPTEACIATGHRNGKITLWWNFFSKEKTVMSTIHWHSLPVQCLAFSPEGSSLLSGGHECVLVRWEMNTDHKDFLPRLGTPLHSLIPSPDGSLVITAHTDNVIQVVTSSLSIQQAVRGLARAHQGAAGGRGVGLVVEPRSGALVTNGRPGHLQFYCMATDHQLFNLDIVGQNYVSPDSLQKPLTVTEVEHAAFDPSGDWLATFQSWEDGALTPEYCLKFWQYKRKTQNYQLNTTVETPHYKAVQCLRFGPFSGQQQPPVMVSTGPEFKLWTLATQHGRAEQQWTCESVGHYGQRGAGEARFSPDGSRLAVVFDTVLTVWNPRNNVLMDKIVMDCSIRCVEFVRGGVGQFIAVSTSSHLTVLDLSSLTVHMQMSVPDALLATDGDLLCAVTAHHDLYVMRPSETQPLLHMKMATEQRVVSAVFLPPTHPHTALGEGEAEDQLGWHSQSRLYLLDTKQRLYTPTLGPKEPHTALSRTQVQLKQVLPQTPFQALLTAHQGQNTLSPAGEVSGHHHAPRPLDGFDVMNERFSTVESFSKRAQRLLETMMVRRKGLGEPMEVQQGRKEGEEEDVDMTAER